MQGLSGGGSHAKQVGAYYNYYVIESAFKNVMNIDTMAVVHFAISTCKWRRVECSAVMNVAEQIRWKSRLKKSRRKEPQYP